MRASVLSPGWIATSLLVSLTTMSAAQDSTVRPIIEMRVARLTPAPGFQQMEFAYPDQLRSGLRQAPYLSGVYVSVQPLLSDADFGAGLDIIADPRGLRLVMKLTPEGAARMRREMTLGEYLATLVNGRLVSAAPLIGYLGSEVPIFVGLHMPGPVADSVAAQLRARRPQ
jgi:hypothetical protein